MKLQKKIAIFFLLVVNSMVSCNESHENNALFGSLCPKNAKPATNFDWNKVNTF